MNIYIVCDIIIYDTKLKISEYRQFFLQNYFCFGHIVLAINSLQYLLRKLYIIKTDFVHFTLNYFIALELLYKT